MFNVFTFFIFSFSIAFSKPLKKHTILFLKKLWLKVMKRIYVHTDDLNTKMQIQKQITRFEKNSILKYEKEKIKKIRRIRRYFSRDKILTVSGIQKHGREFDELLELQKQILG